ncbi:hypothetical protein DID73_00695 [Candidatus Marinamargulisbacteria bacterium SCGC AG-343-K17]|nr:hypothetical protein DID73_00695 [Candidatus Marinamargulisbacteria bacterium SCGC AG-343-K17]
MHIGRPMKTEGLRSAAKVGAGSSLPKGTPVTKAQKKNLLSQFIKTGQELLKGIKDMAKQLGKHFGYSSPSPTKASLPKVESSIPQSINPNSDVETPSSGGFFNLNPTDSTVMPSSMGTIKGLSQLDSTSSMESLVSAGSDTADSTSGDLTKSFRNSSGVSVQIGQTLAEHFMKDGNHEGANGNQINEMSKIANEAFAQVLDTSGRGSLAGAIRDSGVVGDAIEGGSFNEELTTHFDNHDALTLSHFGFKGHSVGLNVFKNVNNTFDIVLCNRGAGNQIPGDDGNSCTFFQVTVNDLDKANELLHTLHDLKQTAKDMGPIYQAMKDAGTTKVLTDVTAKNQITGHCGLLNKQAALKQFSERKTGDIKVYKDERKELFKGIKTYIEGSGNQELKDSLHEYEHLQKVSTTLKGLVQINSASDGISPNPQDSGQTIGQMDVNGIASAIKELKHDVNFKAEMGRVKVYIDKMLKNDQVSGSDRSFLNQVRNNIIELNDDKSDIDTAKFKENVTSLKQTYDTLQSATLDTFQDVMSGMTDEQYETCKGLIHDTAKRLFREEGGTFTKEGAWKTDTPTKKTLFKLAGSKNKSELNANFEALNTAIALDQYKEQLSEKLKDASLDTFQGEISGMTDEQFDVSRNLIRDTAKRLFQEAGGTFAENGAWKTSNSIQNELFNISNSKYLSHCKTHLSHISDIKGFQSGLASISDTDYQGLVSHLNAKSISELSMAECRALEDKISSQTATVSHNSNGRLDPDKGDLSTIIDLLAKRDELDTRVKEIRQSNYQSVLKEYNDTNDPHKKLEICERVVSFSSDYPESALSQFQKLLPAKKEAVVYDNYSKAFNKYEGLMNQFNSASGEDQQKVKQQIIALCDSVIAAGEPKYGSHVEQFKNIKSQLTTSK